MHPSAAFSFLPLPLFPKSLTPSILPPHQPPTLQVIYFRELEEDHAKSAASTCRKALGAHVKVMDPALGIKEHLAEVRRPRAATMEEMTAFHDKEVRERGGLGVEDEVG
jgi:hypothetical protein